jgi:hypothetical protein
MLEARVENYCVSVRKVTVDSNVPSKPHDFFIWSGPWKQPFVDLPTAQLAPIQATMQEPTQ